MVILEMADSHSSCLLCHFVWAHCVIIYVFPDEGFDLGFFGWGTYITVSYEVAYFALIIILYREQQLAHTESLFYSRLLMGLHNKSNPAC